MSELNSAIINNNCFGYSSARLAIVLETDALNIWFVSTFGNDALIDAQRNITAGTTFYSSYNSSFTMASNGAYSSYWNTTNSGWCVTIQSLLYSKFFSTQKCTDTKKLLCEIVL
jgi:hypothetical protein